MKDLMTLTFLFVIGAMIGLFGIVCLSAQIHKSPEEISKYAFETAMMNFFALAAGIMFSSAFWLILHFIKKYY